MCSHGIEILMNKYKYMFLFMKKWHFKLSCPLLKILHQSYHVFERHNDGGAVLLECKDVCIQCKY